MKEARTRLKWYKQRDEDKQKTDMSRNDFEAAIYAFRDWLREEEHEKYIIESERESWMEKLTEHEDWLYEDGADANYTTYDEMKVNLTSVSQMYADRKAEHERRELVEQTAKKALDGYEEKTEDLKETKSWISEDERQQVLDRVKEVREWLDEQLKAQSSLQLYEDPVFKSQEVITKLQALKKLFGKVSNKKKPKPPKPAKNETIEVQAEGNSTESANSTEGANTTESETNKTEQEHQDTPENTSEEKPTDSETKEDL